MAWPSACVAVSQKISVAMSQISGPTKPISTKSVRNWVPDSFWNRWGYVNSEVQTLGREAITMAIGSPERNAKLRQFQDIVNRDIGLIPLFAEYENIVTRENVQGYVSYPDGIPYLAKLSLG